jgi:hypothetical protein
MSTTDVHKTSARIPDGKRPLGRLRPRWEDNIKTTLKEIKYELNSSGSVQEQMTGFCKYGNEPSGFIKCYEFND